MTDLDEAPATLVFDLLYCLVLDETQETLDRREELDAHLASYVDPIMVGDRDQRDKLAATWGRTPGQQRAMRRAIAAGGGDSKAGK